MANAKDDPTRTEPTVNPSTGVSQAASTTDPKQAHATARTGGQKRTLREEDEGADHGPQATREPGKGAPPAAASGSVNEPLPEGVRTDAPVSAPYGPLGTPIGLRRHAGRIRASHSEDIDRQPASRNPAFYSKEAKEARTRLTGDGSQPGAPTEPRWIGGGALTTAPVAATEEELKTTPEELDKKKPQEKEKQPA